MGVLGYDDEYLKIIFILGKDFLMEIK